MKARFTSLVAACLLGFCSSSAFAQSTPLTLEYSAPEGCLTEEQFRDEVAARVGSIPFAEQGTSLVVTIMPQAKGGFLGTLELDGRERVLRNRDCPALGRDLAAALSVQLDAPAAAPAYEPEVGGLGIAGKETVTIDVHADDPSLTLYVVRGQQLAYGNVGGHAATAVGYNFESLCTAPCTLELEPADYHFAIGRGVATPLPLNNRVRVQTPSRFDLDYKSRRGVRIAGFILALAGSLTGAGLLVKGVKDMSTSMMITGSAISGGSLIVGLVLGMVGDRNSLELTPGR